MDKLDISNDWEYYPSQKITNLSAEIIGNFFQRVLAQSPINLQRLVVVGVLYWPVHSFYAVWALQLTFPFFSILSKSFEGPHKMIGLVANFVRIKSLVHMSRYHNFAPSIELLFC